MNRRAFFAAIAGALTIGRFRYPSIPINRRCYWQFNDRVETPYRVHDGGPTREDCRKHGMYAYAPKYPGKGDVIKLIPPRQFENVSPTPL